MKCFWCMFYVCCEWVCICVLFLLDDTFCVYFLCLTQLILCFVFCFDADTSNETIYILKKFIKMVFFCGHYEYLDSIVSNRMENVSLVCHCTTYIFPSSINIHYFDACLFCCFFINYTIFSSCILWFTYWIAFLDVDWLFLFLKLDLGLFCFFFFLLRLSLGFVFLFSFIF